MSATGYVLLDTVVNLRQIVSLQLDGNAFSFNLKRRGYYWYFQQRKLDLSSFSDALIWCCTFFLSLKSFGALPNPAQSCVHTAITTNWNKMCVCGLSSQYKMPPRWFVLHLDSQNVNMSVTHHWSPSHSQNVCDHCGFSLWTSVGNELLGLQSCRNAPQWLASKWFSLLEFGMARVTSSPQPCWRNEAVVMVCCIYSNLAKSEFSLHSVSGLLATSHAYSRNMNQ